MDGYGSAGGLRRNERFSDAMQMMGGTTFDPGRISTEAGRKRIEAYEKANAWQQQGLGAVDRTAGQMTDMMAQTAGAGMQLKTSQAVHDAQMEAARAAANAANTSSLIGTGAQLAGAALMFCERRLKTEIEPISTHSAWAAVRDIPLYSFRYKSNLCAVSYGPMADEVASIDETLVRPSMLPDDKKGVIRGFDVIRYDAYKSQALQMALHRIEELERQLGKLTDAIARLQLERNLALD